MPVIPVNRLQPMMILAENVCNRSGRMLATKGMVLTDQHLRAFKTWGIQEVAIFDDSRSGQKADQGDPAPEKKPGQSKSEEALKPLFRLNDLEHPLIRQLLSLAARQQETES